MENLRIHSYSFFFDQYRKKKQLIQSKCQKFGKEKNTKIPNRNISTIIWRHWVSCWSLIEFSWNSAHSSFIPYWTVGCNEKNLKIRMNKLRILRFLHTKCMMHESMWSSNIEIKKKNRHQVWIKTLSWFHCYYWLIVIIFAWAKGTNKL